MRDRSTSTLAAAALALTLLSAPALAQQQQQQQSLDGYYQGTLVCEQMPNAPAILRAPLDLMVSGKAVIFARPVFNLNGTRTLGSEIATGTLDGETLHVVSMGASYGGHYKGDYAGTIRGRGGMLSGTQTWTLQAGNHTRGCVAAFVKSRWQPQGGTVGTGPDQRDPDEQSDE